MREPGGAGASNHPAAQQGGGRIRAWWRAAPLITTGKPSSSRWSTVRQRVMEWVARTTNSSSVGTAWMIAFPSFDAVTTHLPSALNDAVLTDFACPPSSTASGAAPDRSQTRAVLSADAVTTRLPSELNDAVLTGFVWPRSAAISAPLWASQTRAVMSLEAVTMSLPLGLNDAPRTASVWPVSGSPTGLPVLASHSCAVLSDDAVTT